MAINKDAIIKAVINGEGTPAYGPIPATIFGYDQNVENYGYKFNKDKAISLLEQSGYSKNGKGIMEKDGKELALELSIMAPHKPSSTNGPGDAEGYWNQCKYPINGGRNIN